MYASHPSDDSENHGRVDVDRLSSCTNDRDASTTLRVVQALQIDSSEKAACNQPVDRLDLLDGVRGSLLRF